MKKLIITLGIVLGVFALSSCGGSSVVAPEEVSSSSIDTGISSSSIDTGSSSSVDASSSSVVIDGSSSSVEGSSSSVVNDDPYNTKQAWVENCATRATYEIKITSSVGLLDSIAVPNNRDTRDSSYFFIAKSLTFSDMVDIHNNGSPYYTGTEQILDCAVFESKALFVAVSDWGLHYQNVWILGE